MKKLLTLQLSLLIALTHSLPAAAEDRDWIPYKKFVETANIDKFYNAPANMRDKVRMLIKIAPANKSIKLSDLVLTVGKERLPIGADGILELVPNPVWMKENPMIMTSLPKGEKTSFSPVFAAKLPDGLQFDYAILMGGVQQSNDLVKAQAGMLRFLMPKFTAIEMKFAKPAQQTLRIMAKDGVKTYTANAEGEIALKPTDALMQENPSIVLSERPVEATLGTD